MSKPILDVTLTTVDDQRAIVKAVVDSGSYFTIIRENRLPAGSPILPYNRQKELKTAAAGGILRIIGATQLVVEIGDRIIQDDVLISPDLGRDMLIGAKTMQAWDISVLNENGHTTVRIGRDMRDPEITEVD